MSRRVGATPYVTPVGTNRLQLVLQAGELKRSLAELAKEQQLRIRVIKNLKNPPPKGPLHHQCAACRDESRESGEHETSETSDDDTLKPKPLPHTKEKQHDSLICVKK